MSYFKAVGNFIEKHHTIETAELNKTKKFRQVTSVLDINFPLREKHQLASVSSKMRW